MARYRSVASRPDPRPPQVQSRAAGERPLPPYQDRTELLLARAAPFLALRNAGRALGRDGRDLVGAMRTMAFDRASRRCRPSREGQCRIQPLAGLTQVYCLITSGLLFNYFRRKFSQNDGKSPPKRHKTAIFRPRRWWVNSPPNFVFLHWRRSRTTYSGRSHGRARCLTCGSSPSRTRSKRCAALHEK